MRMQRSTLECSKMPSRSADVAWSQESEAMKDCMIALAIGARDPMLSVAHLDTVSFCQRDPWRSSTEPILRGKHVTQRMKLHRHGHTVNWNQRLPECATQSTFSHGARESHRFEVQVSRGRETPAPPIEFVYDSLSMVSDAWIASFASMLHLRRVRFSMSFPPWMMSRCPRLFHRKSFHRFIPDGVALDVGPPVLRTGTRTPSPTTPSCCSSNVNGPRRTFRPWRPIWIGPRHDCMRSSPNGLAS
jgi:hypothetical protein